MFNKLGNIILASSSPRRLELLKNLGLKKIKVIKPIVNEKIFLEKDKTLIFIIPFAIIIAFSTKGIALYNAKMVMIKVSEEVKKMIQVNMNYILSRNDT